MTKLPTGDVTLLFTDIEGSTRLLAELGPDYARALADQRRIVRACAAAGDGQVVDASGDGFLLVFRNPANALLTAVAIQHRLTEHVWPQGQPLRVRMGIHSGRPTLTDEGYVGLDVHLAARVCAAGHGGQVLVTGATSRLLNASRARLPDLRNMGTHQLKDLTTTVELHQVLVEGLREDFPGLRTLNNRPTNLPTPATALRGRETEVAEVSHLLRDGTTRLVTLTGPGGSGKTRLALEIAARLVEDFPDGVFLAAIAQITDPKLVVPTIAQTIGVQERPGRTLERALREFLAERRLLLVLDNLEQVAGCGPDVAAFVAQCPSLSVLATSREPLQVTGEQQYHVRPLPVPDAADLFTERARALDRAIPVTERGVVEEVCRRLDGLPLAVELAAAWHGVLSPAGILERLDDRFLLLAGGVRDLPERQQTLRRTIDWSHDLLSEDEQRLFGRLAVFVDGWTLTAAEEVCDPDGLIGVPVLRGLRSLLSKNLIHRVEGVDGQPRYSMLETIREYAVARLAEDSSASAVRDAHGEYYAALCRQVRELLPTVEGRTWAARLEQELPNLRAALDHLVSTGARTPALELIVNGWRVWLRTGLVAEGQRLTERVVESFPDQGEDGLAAHAGAVLGEFLRYQGDFAGARQIKESVLPTMRRLDPVTAAYNIADLGVIALEERRLHDAETLLEESLELGRRFGDPHIVGHAHCGLGLLGLVTDDDSAAELHFSAELAAARELDEDEFLTDGLIGLGWVALRRGLDAEAAVSFAESLQICVSMNDVSGGYDALAGMAAVAARRREAPRAIRLLAAVEEWCVATGGVMWFPDERAAQADAMREVVGASEFHEHWEVGRTMSYAEATAHALDVQSPSPTEITPRSGKPFVAAPRT